MKTCSKCKIEKGLGCFSKNKAARDGLQSSCKACAKVYRKENKERISTSQKAWYGNNKERCVNKSRAYYSVNKERCNARSKDWYEDNKVRHAASREAWVEKNKYMAYASVKAWKKANRWRVSSVNARYRAAKLERTVSTSEWEQFAIEEIYALSQARTKATGVQHHVDHIVPLQGKLVSGLHVAHNLQVIEAAENLSKSNKFEVN